MDKEVVKALKAQQEAHNEQMLQQAEYYEAKLDEKQAQIDALILDRIGDKEVTENV